MTEAKSSLALLPNNEFPPSLEQELARALGKTTPSRSPLAGPGSHAAAEEDDFMLGCCRDSRRGCADFR
jgi:hypothetical protein